MTILLLVTSLVYSAPHPYDRPNMGIQQESVFDLPVTMNKEVDHWIRFFQTRGKSHFRRWLERSTRYSEFIRKELQSSGLPKDIFYTAMIESGFSPNAKSHAAAVGLWQFIKPTAKRYGLKVNWWIDERRNFVKSTRAAIKYKKDLYKMFGSWPLVAASYNCGENRVARIIKKYRTNDFWYMARLRLLPKETRNYVPKIIAATMISQSPETYGFKNLAYKPKYEFEQITVRGGTDLSNLAKYIGVRSAYLKELNPELVHGFIPRSIGFHTIQIPKGAKPLVSKYNATKIL